jgi:hypothetical protein
VWHYGKRGRSSEYELSVAEVAAGQDHWIKTTQRALPVRSALVYLRFVVVWRHPQCVLSSAQLSVRHTASAHITSRSLAFARFHINPLLLASTLSSPMLDHIVN